MKSQKKSIIIIITFVVLFIVWGLTKSQLEGRFGFGELGDTPREALEKSGICDRDIREDITVIDLGNHGIMYVADTMYNEVMLIHMNRKNDKYYVDCMGDRFLPMYQTGYYLYVPTSDIRASLTSLKDVHELGMNFSTGIFVGYISYSDNLEKYIDIDESQYEICTFMSPENDPNRREVTIAWRIEEYPDN